MRLETWWDLGIGDPTAIWFAQRVGHEVHLIDYYESSGEGLAHYAGVLEERRLKHKYLYSSHALPFDAKAQELGTGKTRVEVMQSLGLNPEIVVDHHVQDGIEAVRNLIPRCWFDSEKCAYGIRALELYSKDWDDVRQVFRNKPRHDLHSHAADAFRYGAMHRPSKKSGPIKWPEKMGVY